MDTRINILIRDYVYSHRGKLLGGYGLTDSNSEHDIKEITTVILNKIESWVDINVIATRVFDEMVSLVTDSMATQGTFEDYENEIKKLAKHCSYQNYKSEATPEGLLKTIDWESVERAFKKELG